MKMKVIKLMMIGGNNPEKKNCRVSRGLGYISSLNSKSSTKKIFPLASPLFLISKKK